MSIHKHLRPLQLHQPTRVLLVILLTMMWTIASACNSALIVAVQAILSCTLGALYLDAVLSYSPLECVLLCTSCFSVEISLRQIETCQSLCAH